MAALTDAMCRHNALSPVTDSPHIHRAFGAMDQLTELLTGRPSRARALADATEAYPHLALQAVIQPKKLTQVPVANILKFRERHNAELGAFRDHVAGLSEELRRVAEVENLEVANAHLQALYEQQTRPKLDELRRAPAWLRRGVGGRRHCAEGRRGCRHDPRWLRGGRRAAGTGRRRGRGDRCALYRGPVPSPPRADRLTVAYLLAANRELAGPQLLRAMQR